MTALLLTNGPDKIRFGQFITNNIKNINNLLKQNFKPVMSDADDNYTIKQYEFILLSIDESNVITFKKLKQLNVFDEVVYGENI